MGRLLRITDGFGKVRKIGMLNNETLRLWRDKEKHLYHKLNAWCLDYDVFQAQEQVKFFIVKEKSGGRYFATRETWEEYGEVFNWIGYGEQIGLPLDKWTEFKE